MRQRILMCSKEAVASLVELLLEYPPQGSPNVLHSLFSELITARIGRLVPPSFWIQFMKRMSDPVWERCQTSVKHYLQNLKVANQAEVNAIIAELLNFPCQSTLAGADSSDLTYYMFGSWMNKACVSDIIKVWNRFESILHISISQLAALEKVQIEGLNLRDLIGNAQYSSWAKDRIMGSLKNGFALMLKILSKKFPKEGEPAPMVIDAVKKVLQSMEKLGDEIVAAKFGGAAPLDVLTGLEDVVETQTNVCGMKSYQAGILSSMVLKRFRILQVQEKPQGFQLIPQLVKLYAQSQAPELKAAILESLEDRSNVRQVVAICKTVLKFEFGTDMVQLFINNILNFEKNVNAVIQVISLLVSVESDINMSLEALIGGERMQLLVEALVNRYQTHRAIFSQWDKTRIGRSFCCELIQKKIAFAKQNSVAEFSIFFVDEWTANETNLLNDQAPVHQLVRFLPFHKARKIYARLLTGMSSLEDRISQYQTCITTQSILSIDHGKDYVTDALEWMATPLKRVEWARINKEHPIMSFFRYFVSLMDGKEDLSYWRHDELILHMLQVASNALGKDPREQSSFLASLDRLLPPRVLCERLTLCYQVKEPHKDLEVYQKWFKARCEISFDALKLRAGAQKADEEFKLPFSLTGNGKLNEGFLTFWMSLYKTFLTPSAHDILVGKQFESQVPTVVFIRWNDILKIASESVNGHVALEAPLSFYEKIAGDASLDVNIDLVFVNQLKLACRSVVKSQPTYFDRVNAAEKLFFQRNAKKHCAVLDTYLTNSIDFSSVREPKKAKRDVMVDICLYLVSICPSALLDLRVRKTLLQYRPKVFFETLKGQMSPDSPVLNGGLFFKGRYSIHEAASLVFGEFVGRFSTAIRDNYVEVLIMGMSDANESLCIRLQYAGWLCRLYDKHLSDFQKIWKTSIDTTTPIQVVSKLCRIVFMPDHTAHEAVQFVLSEEISSNRDLFLPVIRSLHVLAERYGKEFTATFLNAIVTDAEKVGVVALNEVLLYLDKAADAQWIMKLWQIRTKLHLSVQKNLLASLIALLNSRPDDEVLWTELEKIVRLREEISHVLVIAEPESRKSHHIPQEPGMEIDGLLESKRKISLTNDGVVTKYFQRIVKPLMTTPPAYEALFADRKLYLLAYDRVYVWYAVSDDIDLEMSAWLKTFLIKTTWICDTQDPFAFQNLLLAKMTQLLKGYWTLTKNVGEITDMFVYVQGLLDDVVSKKLTIEEMVQRTQKIQAILSHFSPLLKNDKTKYQVDSRYFNLSNNADDCVSVALSSNNCTSFVNFIP